MSYRAAAIDREYRLKQYYQNKKKQSAEEYIKRAREKGLTYWSAVDFLKHHKTMHSII